MTNQRENEVMKPDCISFSWWSDDELLDFALDYDKTIALNEDNTQELIYALARRLDDIINED